ncbi:ogr/Delta-like zinc finger family protein [Photobacterium phosphoreum]|uniref:ogr/Delta-like zinc finger family protein n=1 Tax=Photobacterium phosphoreum TaxID=659 RepID=UPI000D17E301|nr:ogr/Delta-like zinc finger family protein [Photobacterium phosphoreum]PSU74792.1 transcriptional regulator [Photobacterium phosphoreum]PTB32407.1 transcriptional regulator [Photobacterium phosphoreum]
MRVSCNQCGEKARIGKTNWFSCTSTCSCTEPECGHTFVMSLGFSHTLSPSAKNTNELVMALVKVMSPEQAKQLHSQLSLL